MNDPEVDQAHPRGTLARRVYDMSYGGHSATQAWQEWTGMSALGGSILFLSAMSFVFVLVATALGSEREDRDDAGRAAANSRSRIVSYRDGTLVLDIVGTETERQIWRGWAIDVVVDDLDPKEIDRKVDEAVHRILARFPAVP